ncbi:MAG: hypothetical protein R2939_12160 [Kofleriaceae bacterium]
MKTSRGSLVLLLAACSSPSTNARPAPAPEEPPAVAVGEAAAPPPATVDDAAAPPPRDASGPLLDPALASVERPRWAEYEELAWPPTLGGPCQLSPTSKLGEPAFELRCEFPDEEVPEDSWTGFELYVRGADGVLTSVASFNADGWFTEATAQVPRQEIFIEGEYSYPIDGAPSTLIYVDTRTPSGRYVDPKVEVEATRAFPSLAAYCAAEVGALPKGATCKEAKASQLKGSKPRIKHGDLAEDVVALVAVRVPGVATTRLDLADHVSDQTDDDGDIDGWQVVRDVAGGAEPIEVISFRAAQSMNRTHVALVTRDPQGRARSARCDWRDAGGCRRTPSAP